MSTQSDKAELMDRIERSWQELERTVSQFSEEQLTTPGPDGWAIKDHLAHLAVWERSLVALLEGRDRAAAMGLADAAGLDEDEVNRRLHLQHRDITASDARALLSRTHDEVRIALGKLSGADLQAPYRRYQPGDPGSREDEPVIHWVAGNTYEHADQHRGWMAELIQRQT